MQIEVVSFDPSITNFGMCRARLDLDTLEIKPYDLRLFQTESEAKSKNVRKQSDDMRRAREVIESVHEYSAHATLLMSEIPLGTASLMPHAILNSGMVIGILASMQQPLIQVTPQEVKMAAVGVRDAAKEEMIEWAFATYPDLPWLTRKLKGKTVPTKANEHLADACGVLHAGIKTPQFNEIRSMLKAAMRTFKV